MRFDLAASLARNESRNPTITTDRHDRSMNPKIPPAAAEKLCRLQDALDEAAALARAANDLRSETLQQKMDIDRQLRTAREIRRPTYAVPKGEAQPEDPEIPRLTEKLERANDELRRRDAQADARNARSQALGGLVTNNLVRAIDAINGAAQPWNGAPAKPQKGERLPDAVNRLRGKREQLLADLRAVHAAPRPAAEAKAAIVSEIDALAARGRPNLLSLVENGSPMKIPSTRADVAAWRSTDKGTFPDPSPPTVQIPDAIGFIAWLYRDDVVAALHAEIDTLSDDKSALSDQQRHEKAAEIRAQILAVERDEESLIEQIAEAGGEVLRRVDHDYRAVLNLADDTPAPRN